MEAQYVVQCCDKNQMHHRAQSEEHQFWCSRLLPTDSQAQRGFCCGLSFGMHDESVFVPSCQVHSIGSRLVVPFFPKSNNIGV